MTARPGNGFRNENGQIQGYSDFAHRYTPVAASVV